MLGNFLCFCCPDKAFQKKSFRNTIKASNGLDLDQDQHSVCPDLGPKFQTVWKGYQQMTKVAAITEVKKQPILSEHCKKINIT